MGPGQTRLELGLTLVPSIAALVAAAVALALAGYSSAKVAIGAALAFDLVGGVVANAATAGQRWYHRPDATAREQFGFVALHLPYIAIVGLVFLDRDWAFVGVIYSLLLMAAAAALVVPLYVQRPVARIGFVVGTAVGLGFFSLPPELQWFVPLLYCKLLISHLTREAPFAPARRGGAGGISA